MIACCFHICTASQYLLWVPAVAQLCCWLWPRGRHQRAACREVPVQAQRKHADFYFWNAHSGIFPQLLALDMISLNLLIQTFIIFVCKHTFQARGNGSEDAATLCATLAPAGVIEGVRRLRVSVLAGFGELRGGWAGLPAARSTVDVPAEHGHKRSCGEASNMPATNQDETTQHGKPRTTSTTRNHTPRCC